MEKEQRLQVMLEWSHESTPGKWQNIEGKWPQEWLEKLSTKNYILRINDITKGERIEKSKDWTLGTPRTGDVGDERWSTNGAASEMEDQREGPPESECFKIAGVNNCFKYCWELECGNWEITPDFAIWRPVVTFPRAVSVERWEQKTDWSGFKNE